MDLNRPRSINPTVSPYKLANGFILPEGKLTPNSLFVGGIDMKVDENEIKEFFARYGSVREVKIIRYRGGLCKGYGFVYFNEDVDIQSIIEQQIIFMGRKLKLGPAILKEKRPRSIPPGFVGNGAWMNPTQYFYCACCPPLGGGVTQPSPIVSGGTPYNQPYSYSNFGGIVIPQMPVSYPQNAYTYQYSTPAWTPDQRTHPLHQSFVDCGVQTMRTVL